MSNELQIRWISGEAPQGAFPLLNQEQMKKILNPERDYTRENFERMYLCSFNPAKKDEDKNIIPTGSFVAVMLYGHAKKPYQVLRHYEHEGRLKYRIRHLDSGSERSVSAKQIYAILTDKDVKEIQDRTQKN